MDLASTIALSMGAAWASGLNLYAAVLMLGLAGETGLADLPDGLEPLAHPLVIAAAGLLYCVEFIADKVPGVDSGWDTLHTFIRIPAGAALAVLATSDAGAAGQVAALLAGATLAAGTHATKAGGRVLLNASPEPVSNWTASVGEDLAVFGGLWAALVNPWLFLALLAVFVAFVAWALPRIVRAIAGVGRGIGRWFRGDAARSRNGPD